MIHLTQHCIFCLRQPSELSLMLTGRQIICYTINKNIPGTAVIEIDSISIYITAVFFVGSLHI